jgi:hypothetical protein
MDDKAKQLLCYHKTKAASFDAHGFVLFICGADSAVNVCKPLSKIGGNDKPI